MNDVNDPTHDEARRFVFRSREGVLEEDYTNEGDTDGPDDIEFALPQRPCKPVVSGTPWRMSNHDAYVLRDRERYALYQDGNY